MSSSPARFTLTEHAGADAERIVGTFPTLEQARQHAPADDRHLLDSTRDGAEPVRYGAWTAHDDGTFTHRTIPALADSAQRITGAA